MLYTLVSLLVLIVVLRLVYILVRIVLTKLGLDRRVREIADEGRLSHEIVEKLDEVERWRARRKLQRSQGSKLGRKAGPKLSAEQIVAVRKAEHQIRDSYLDTMHLSWYQIVVIFTVGSIGGLILEEIWMYVTAGLTESRVGLVWGPFSPLYGFGAVFLTVACFGLYKRQTPIWVVFLVSLVLGGTLEQITGWGMETLFDIQSWTYIYLPDHITKWVAWRFLFFWGALGVVWYKYVMPWLLYYIGMPSRKRQVVFVAILAVYLAADITMTLLCFTRMTARDMGRPPQNAFEAWVDENYSDEFITSRFQNMVVGKEL